MQRCGRREWQNKRKGTANLPIESVNKSTDTSKKIDANNVTRTIIINVSDLYHCPHLGYFPFDGDCQRFLACKDVEEENGKIRGKVYRCPKDYIFSSSAARCQSSDSVPCHRSNTNGGFLL